MNIEEKKRKLENLPYQAIFDEAIKRGIAKEDINKKSKVDIIMQMLLNKLLDDAAVAQLINDYIYGDRVTFTLWTFKAKLKDEDYTALIDLEGNEEKDLLEGFHNLKIISVKEISNRIELTYVYAKEYKYIDENGNNDSVWEQHRGCVWIGRDVTYLASISKHERMTLFMNGYIGKIISNKISQIKPPKAALDNCIDIEAISRCVWQSSNGEKTVISRIGGFTEEQSQEVQRIKTGRINTSGSYIANIAEDIKATIRYNVKKGTIGIYRHIPASILFAWSEEAIKIIFEEIEALKARPVEEIYREMGLVLEWNGQSPETQRELNWYLSQVLQTLEQGEIEVQVTDAMSILQKRDWFISMPRLYCEECDSYEIPYCPGCHNKLSFTGNNLLPCECGAPLKYVCSEGHANCKIEYLYVPTTKFKQMIDKKIKAIFKDDDLTYNMCIWGDVLHINMQQDDNIGDEIFFDQINCFENDITEIPEHIKKYAIRLGEKCDISCTHKNVDMYSNDWTHVCLPKIFYNILPGFTMQPHKGNEYGDISANVMVERKSYEMIGIIKKCNTTKLEKPLLMTDRLGEEIIRQFVEQGMMKASTELIAIIIPRRIDNGFKGALRYLAKLSHKKVVFMELEQVCKVIMLNTNICVPETD